MAAGPVSSYLLSCWNKASSMLVLSSTVMDTTATGASAPRGKTPGIRSSCQSEWILQMSTESKYLQSEPSSERNESIHHVCLDQLPNILNLIKSEKSIQKRPSSARWVQSAFLRCGGQLGQSSDQGPVQEKRPQGFLSCSNLSRDADGSHQYVLKCTKLINKERIPLCEVAFNRNGCISLVLI